MEILETERLLLRQITPGDLDDLYALFRDPQVKKFVYAGAMSYEGAEEELDWIIDVYGRDPGFGLWGTVWKESKEFIGRCGLLRWVIDGQSEVELTYMLAKRYWGRGLGTEIAGALMQYGFEVLNLGRMICCIDPENRASIRVAEKLGMRFEKQVDTGDGPELLFARTRAIDGVAR